ncbi:MAG: Asp-tRNA(Asn)/Glu-tRNA(Gln) amidotransferase subunit GatC [Eggerthellaceae bacterium]|nr:Asp-tRNA(Asn)/Glu-tRNA(Gln) amidotransferase subunit GatC [Eggerthellaceae bacterium]
MTEPLTEADVRAIAEYVRIALDDNEIAAMTRDLNATITTTLAAIGEYDLAGVEPTFHPIGGLANVVREDVEVPGFTQAEALANAPKAQDGSFLIPAILADGGAA